MQPRPGIQAPPVAYGRPPVPPGQGVGYQKHRSIGILDINQDFHSLPHLACLHKATDHRLQDSDHRLLQVLLEHLHRVSVLAW